jgi:ABC-2 type transport system permease protein
MTNPLKSPFATIFSAEVLFNSKRLAPYFLILLFTAHSVLWWGWSVAASYGWGTNSDLNIARNLGGFSFILGLPIFNAVIMGDPVIRDFRAGIDPLIFSKPVGRASYILGKFFGNFFVLVCCMSAFMLTMLVLQWFPSSRLVVLPVRVFPYFKHFFLIVVISHLFLAVVYFAAGTLTRNSKIVYGIAGSFYPVYISYQLFLLKNLPQSWRVMLDPLMMGGSQPIPAAKWHDAAWINQIVVRYSSVMIANRALWILMTAVCLTIVYFRFAIVERPQQSSFSALNLSTAAEGVYYPDRLEPAFREEPAKRDSVALPEVTRLTEGIGANLKKLFAAVSSELLLLRSERSVVVIMPLAVLISTLEVAFWQVAPDPTYSAGYAGNTARSLLLFMIGITVFYTVEAMHRDHDQRIESILWSQPVPNYVLLLSKLLATLLVILALVVLDAVITIILQAVKHNGPIELMAYAKIYFVIVVPNAIFMAAAALSLSVLIRDRYLAYALAIGVGAGLFYLYTQGHNHWLYNPLLFQLWDYAGLSGPKDSYIFWNRLYIFGLAGLFVSFAHLWDPRKSGKHSIRSGTTASQR